MATLKLNGHVFFGIPGPGGVGVRCAGADVTVYDGDRSIYSGTTNGSGDFSGTGDVDDFDHGHVTLPGHWGKDAWGHDVLLPGGTHDQDTSSPHVPNLKIKVQLAGLTSDPLPFAPSTPVTPVCPVPTPWAAPFTCLPSGDPAPVIRNLRLRVQQGIYRWSRPGNVAGVAFDPPLAFCDGIPPAELPPPDYVTNRSSSVERVLNNKQQLAHHAAIQSVADYRTLYPVLPQPGAIADSYTLDRSFAAQRLAGVNPMVIKKVSSLPADFPVTDAHLAPFVADGNGALARALAEGRLYLADYDILDGIHAAGDGKRYLPSPYALFYYGPPRTQAVPIKHPILDRASPLPVAAVAGRLTLPDPTIAAADELTPVAIQIERRYDAAANPIITPASGADLWFLAKLMVQVADVNVHEMQFHLWNCHFAMEPFAVATARQLDLSHPLSILLRKHFPVLIANNDLGRHTLVARSNVATQSVTVDNLLGSDLSGSVEILRRARQRWTFAGTHLKEDLRLRGLLDPAQSIKDYPFRDDALLVWDAIEQFVNGYVSHYYSSDDAVAGDGELQGWRHELDGLLPGGFAAIGQRSQLVQVITQIIFQSSAQHAAINFPQYQFIGWIPNMPGAAWANPLPAPRGSGERDLVKILPPLEPAVDQIDLVGTLALYQYDKLGYYHAPFDTDVNDLAVAFRNQLATVETTIDQRNQSRWLTYPWLCPSMIPNSTSI